MTIQIFRHNFKAFNKEAGTSLVVGNFDGLHKGHQSLIQKAVEVAKEQNLTPVLYTFEPHPKKLFLKDKAPKPITPFAVKASLLENMGIHTIIARAFTKEFSGQSFTTFLQHLQEDLNVKHITVGEDFAFGKGRQCDANKLKEESTNYGFTVNIVKDLLCEDGERFSSSRVRDLLEQGHVLQAQNLLGRPFQVRTFLTEDDYCNLKAPFLRYTPVKNGVYWAKVRYTHPSLKNEGGVVPLKVQNNVGYIPPLPDMPELVEGQVLLSLMDKIEK